jgi:hypothetical protein
MWEIHKSRFARSVAGEARGPTTSQKEVPQPTIIDYLNRKRGCVLERAGLIVLSLTAALLLTYFVFIYDPKSFQPPSPPIQPPSPPISLYQKEFCKILEDAGEEYHRLLHLWSAAEKEKNGIVQQRISSEMNAIVRKRNQQTFTLVQQKSFAVDNTPRAPSIHDPYLPSWVSASCKRRLMPR